LTSGSEAIVKGFLGLVYLFFAEVVDITWATKTNNPLFSSCFGQNIFTMDFRASAGRLVCRRQRVSSTGMALLRMTWEVVLPMRSSWRRLRP